MANSRRFSGNQCFNCGRQCVPATDSEGHPYMGCPVCRIIPDAEAMTDRDKFVQWFHSLSPDERVEVWYECEAMTRKEVEGQLAALRAQLAAALKTVKQADRYEALMRDSDFGGLVLHDYRAARAELANLMGET